MTKEKLRANIEEIKRIITSMKSLGMMLSTSKELPVEREDFYVNFELSEEKLYTMLDEMLK